MPGHSRNNSYILSLDDYTAWNLTGTGGTESWLRQFASVLGLRPGIRDGLPRIRFICRAGTSPAVAGPARSPESIEVKRLALEGWQATNCGVLRYWSRSGVSDIVCEILNPPSRKIAVLMMREALHPVYHKAVTTGGVPLHGALVEWNGHGVLLAGANDAGKTTCCQRLPNHWKVLCDDETLVVGNNAGDYFAHPFPTWSNHFRSRSIESCDVSRRVPLSAVFFLQQAPSVELLPMGRGQGAARINESAGQACFWRVKGMGPGPKRAWTTKVFENACDLAQNVPAFLLRLNLTGRFWEEIERLLAHRPGAPHRRHPPHRETV